MTVASATDPTPFAAEAIKSLLLELLVKPDAISPLGALALSQILRSATNAQTGRTEK
ncbi:MAG: hypothetical protein ACK4Z3_00940 [Rhizobium rosettiformans]